MAPACGGSQSSRGRSRGTSDERLFSSWPKRRGVGVELLRIRQRYIAVEANTEWHVKAIGARYLIGSKKRTRLYGVPTTSHLESMLRGAALRMTRPRVAVLSAVHDHPHADTDSIIGVVREDLGEVSRQAVYDVLHALTAAGLVRRFEPMGSVARYEARIGDNHHPGASAAPDG